MAIIKYKDGNEWKETPNAVAYQKVVLDGINFSRPLFSYNSWNNIIEKGAFETKNLITDSSSSGLGGSPQAGAFYKCTELTEIPFSLNFKSNNGVDLQNCFKYCNELKHLPDIQCDEINNLNYTFNNCSLITEIPQCYYTPTYTAKQYNGLFEYCTSLRVIPQQLLNKIIPNNGSLNTIYCLFSRLYIIDEINGAPVNLARLSSNRHASLCEFCFRIKSFTFRMDNGAPIISQWSEQVIDLSKNNGYALAASGTNSCIYGDITSDKLVSDETSYNALKNDPDWWTNKVEYSRYNKLSAIETINSLPDTSAYLAENGGTNTIKFKGAAGSATDGGAINTMTEEEIAVATAKGWTVSFV